MVALLNVRQKLFVQKGVDSFSRAAIVYVFVLVVPGTNAFQYSHIY